MPETELLSSERVQDRGEVAAFLGRVAEKLDGDGTLTLRAGEQSVTLDPPARSTFEVDVERDGPADGPGTVSVEFEIEWDEADERTTE